MVENFFLSVEDFGDAGGHLAALDVNREIHQGPLR